MWHWRLQKWLLKNQLCHHRNKLLRFKIYSNRTIVLNYNNISQLILFLQFCRSNKYSLDEHKRLASKTFKKHNHSKLLTSPITWNFLALSQLSSMEILGLYVMNTYCTLCLLGITEKSTEEWRMIRADGWSWRGDERSELMNPILMSVGGWLWKMEWKEEEQVEEGIELCL